MVLHPLRTAADTVFKVEEGFAAQVLASTTDIEGLGAFHDHARVHLDIHRVEGIFANHIKSLADASRGGGGIIVDLMEGILSLVE